MLDKLNLDLDPILIKMALLCASLGLVVSLFSCLIGGAGFPAVLYRPILYAMMMGAIGAIMFYFLTFTAPEVINEFKGDAAGIDDLADSSEDSLADDLAFDQIDDSDSTTVDTSVDSDVLSSGDSMGMGVGGKVQRKAKPGEIMVEGVPIKNEPKVMAEAIKHLLSQDED